MGNLGNLTWLWYYSTLIPGYILTLFCNFFFLEIQTRRPSLYFIITQKDNKESWVTREAISSRDDSIQTCSSLPETDFLARKWATELPMLFAWEKLQHRKSFATIKMSLIRCPYSGLVISLARIALIMTSESPSTKTSNMLNSFAKYKALLEH